MNKISRLFLGSVLTSGLMTVFLMATSAWAQEEPVPFECASDAYTVRDRPAELFRIDQQVDPFEFIPIGAPLTGPFGAGGAMKVGGSTREPAKPSSPPTGEAATARA